MVSVCLKKKKGKEKKETQTQKTSPASPSFPSARAQQLIRPNPHPSSRAQPAKRSNPAPSPRVHAPRPAPPQTEAPRALSFSLTRRAHVSAVPPHGPLAAPRCALPLTALAQLQLLLLRFLRALTGHAEIPAVISGDPLPSRAPRSRDPSLNRPANPPAPHPHISVAPSPSRHCPPSLEQS